MRDRGGSLDGASGRGAGAEIDHPGAGGAGSVRATTGTPACLAAMHVASATTASSGSPAAGSMTRSRSGGRSRIARRTLFGEFCHPVLAESPVGVVGHRDSSFEPKSSPEDSGG
jgi:hypothetical protein